jgi:hypothetical protein
MSDDGLVVLVQVNPTAGGVRLEGATEDFVQASREKLKQVAGVVKTSWTNLVSEMRAMPDPPSEVSVEFGVDVGAEGGLPFITKGSISANFKVSIVWKTEKS